MRSLNQHECEKIAGGDGYRLVFVAVDIMDATAAPMVSTLVGKLFDGEMDTNSLADAIANAGGSLVEYMLVKPH